MYLALGNGEFVPFKVNDFAAYERQTRRRLEEVLGAGQPTGLYPEPVEHCAICRWRELCAGRRRQGDLSLVAGMATGQRRALKAAGIATRGFAGLAELPGLNRVSRDSLERSQTQARLQFRRRGASARASCTSGPLGADARARLCTCTCTDVGGRATEEPSP
jgi:predicted RecB family nuclease